LFISMLPPPPTPTLFPYTTLFRSRARSLIAPVASETWDDFGLSLHFGRTQGFAGSSNAPMSRRTMQSRLPSSARGRPSASSTPAGGAIGFPASIKGELDWRWKFVALTNWGLAEVWKRWQELPAVVGPRE